jgi:uncharacterized membrane protein
VLDILEWILAIAALDLRRMSPATLFFCVLVFGGLGLILTIVPLATLFEAHSWAQLPGVLLALALGLAMLARIAYGLYDRWHGRTTDAAKDRTLE